MHTLSAAMVAEDFDLRNEDMIPPMTGVGTTRLVDAESNDEVMVRVMWMCQRCLTEGERT